MTKRKCLIGICALSIFFLPGRGLSNSPIQKTYLGVSIGFGLPKIPISRFRTPISVLGGGFLNYRLGTNMALQLNGYGLYTFSLGTVNAQSGELRFNLLWASMDLQRRLRGVIDEGSFLMAGVGGYRLSQQYDNDEDILNTMGLSIGLSQWKRLRRVTSIFEIRWHLLFHPSPKPQVVTVNFGIMF